MVEVRVKDELVATALRSLLPDSVAQARLGAPTIVITDDVIQATGDAVLIVGNSALSAARAMALINAGRLSGACSIDSLASIQKIVDAVQNGLTGLPSGFAKRASSAPVLDEATLQTMTYIQRGFSNVAIARTMNCSQSTVKRRVNHLLIAFNAHNRHELAVVSLN